VQTVGKKSEVKAVGRSRGGLTTKIHAIVDGFGNPVVFLLSPGNDHDSTHAVEVFRKVQIEGSNVLGDRAYGSQEIRKYITDHGTSYTVLPKSNASHPWLVDWWLYKERHLVECFFQKIKWFRRVSTRYDKIDSPFDQGLFFKQGLGIKASLLLKNLSCLKLMTVHFTLGLV